LVSLVFLVSFTPFLIQNARFSLRVAVMSEKGGPHLRILNAKRCKGGSWGTLVPQEN
jgi:hypothetical protein